MSGTPDYDPFAPGPLSVAARTVEARDAARDRVFPCEIWSPADAPGTYPLVVFSHSSGGGRLQSTYLCEHLSGHGYVVAALDHSEFFAPELAAKDGETADERAARARAWIANRVPDVRFLLDFMLGGDAPDYGAAADPERVGIAGHSFGGWTALAATEADRRIKAVVALAPAGSSRPRPGVLPPTLDFAWGRDVPTLYVVAENDTPLPLDGMYELFDRTQATKRMVVLRRADHMHFMDRAEEMHEAVRATPFSGELAWMSREMLPISELSSGEQAHLAVRGLALSHFDAVLKDRENARRFLAGDVAAALAARGAEAFAHEP